MKKTKYALCVLLVTVMAFLAFACDNGNKNDSAISLDKAEMVLDRFESGLLTATLTDNSQTVVWSTSKDSVAVVTDGLVEARGEGKATITATASGGSSASCEVTVDDSGAIPQLSVSAALSVPTGETRQLDVKGTYKRVDIDASVTYSSSDSAVVTVNETGLVTAVSESLSNNTAVITVAGSYMGYTMSNKTVKVTVTIPTVDKAEYAFNLDTSLATATTTLHTDIVGSTVISIVDEATGVDVFTSAEGSVITFDKSKLNVGERFFLIETPGKVYRVPVIVATQVINNKAEFTTYMKLMNSRSGPVNDGKQHSFDEYYLLAADIDCAGEVYERWISWGAFMGIFNGGGHVIRNMAVPQDGMFRISRGTIKNFALVDATYASTGSGGFVVGEFYGTVENVFVHGKVTGAVGGSFGGIANQIRNGAVIKNCVAVVELVGSSTTEKGGIVGNFNNTSGPSILNCFSVNNIATDLVGNAGTGTSTITGGGNYKTVAELIADQPDLSGFTDAFWDVSAGFPISAKHMAAITVSLTSDTSLLSGETLTLTSNADPFVTYSIVGETHGAAIVGNVLTPDAELDETKTIKVRATSVFDSAKYEEKTVTIIVKPIIDKASYAFNLDMSDATVTATLNAAITGIVSIKDEVTKAAVYTSAAGQVVTFNKTNLTAGERAFLIELADEVYRVPVIVATQIIKDKAGFLAIRTGNASFANQYFLLGNDLNFAGDGQIVQGGTTGFGATLNGNGYSIKNIKIPSEGIFRILDGTVKNIAVVGATFTGAGSLAGWIRGSAEICDVYVQATITSTGGFGGIVNSVRDGSVKITNCVAVFEPASGALTGTKGGIANETEKGAIITNCFSVSSLATNLVGNDKTTAATIVGGGHYKTVAALTTALNANAELLADFEDAAKYPLGITVSLTSDTSLLSGETLTLTSNADPFVTYSIVGETHGAAIVGNVLTPDAELDETKTIKVRATSVFDSAKYEEKTVTIIVKPIIDKASYAFNLDMSDVTVTATLNAAITGIVSIKDEVTKAAVYTSAAGQVVTFNKANLTAGERAFLIELADEVYRVPVIVATQIIKDTAGFLTLRAGATELENQYFMLGNDLNFTGVTMDTAGTKHFKATFNGNGYSIKNVTLPRHGGLFRIVGDAGVIKNFSLIDAVFNNAGGEGAFVAGWLIGKAENIYVKGTVSADISTGTFIGGICADLRESSALIKNCVAVIDYSDTITKTDNKGGIAGAVTNTTASTKIVNSFSVSSFITSTNNGGLTGKAGTITVEDSEHYADMTTLETAAQGDATLFDGIAASDFWAISGTTLTFNGTVVFDWTE